MRAGSHQPGAGNLDTIVTMNRIIARLRPLFDRGRRGTGAPCEEDADACSWDRMRAVCEEQAARGDPEAVRGLDLIEQDRWPSSGRPRAR